MFHVKQKIGGIYMSFIFNLSVILIVVIMFIFTISSLTSKKQHPQSSVNYSLSSIQESEAYLKKLKIEIDIKERELETLRNNIGTFTNRSISDLPLMVENVIEAYERQGIVLPLDIIDDLTYQVFNDEDQTQKYIEAQRSNWKVKNSQKFIKGIM